MSYFLAMGSSLFRKAAVWIHVYSFQSSRIGSIRQGKAAEPHENVHIKAVLVGPDLKALKGRVIPNRKDLVCVLGESSQIYTVTVAEFD